MTSKIETCASCGSHFHVILASAMTRCGCGGRAFIATMVDPARTYVQGDDGLPVAR